MKIENAMPDVMLTMDDSSGDDEILREESAAPIALWIHLCEQRHRHN
jgi:hypothetical protein